MLNYWPSLQSFETLRAHPDFDRQLLPNHIHEEAMSEAYFHDSIEYMRYFMSFVLDITFNHLYQDKTSEAYATYENFFPKSDVSMNLEEFKHSVVEYVNKHIKQDQTDLDPASV